MAVQTTYTYWTVCWKWGFIPYPCKKTTTGWCYTFQQVHVNHWGVYCTYDGCENGIRYKWSGWCLGFGSSTVYNVTRCYQNKLSESGTCGEVVIG